MLLKDKVCIVAGASSLRSIGYATAELFIKHGAHVVVTDVMMNDDVLNQIKFEIEKNLGVTIKIDGIQCDISKKSECDRLIAQVQSKYGTIDCLVNSAGIVRSGPILDIQEAEMSLMFDINLKGAFFLCQSVLEIFVKQKYGNIVNVSSLAAQRGGGLVGGAHYAASKGGMLSLTKSIAREFGHLGIRANSICPAMIDTPMVDGLTPERLQSITDTIPLKRMGTTREMAGTCLFLASELSGFVTGATIDVNGGAHIH
jgi:NAD(P)-dependent dehydrogenase (short-subunit alcohol dehydrogenase family)